MQARHYFHLRPNAGRGFGHKQPAHFAPHHIEQGTQNQLVAQSAHGRHGSESGYATATQKIEKQGFSLIVGMVREQEHIGIALRKSSVTRIARCGLQPFASRIDLHPDNGARHVQFIGQRDDKIRPSISVRGQSVMNMQGRNNKTRFNPGLVQQMQKNH